MADRTYSASDARALLPELLERAHRGEAIVVTKHGRPYAAIVPVEQVEASRAGASLLALAGSGRGLWGRSGSASTRRRDEWSRKPIR